MALNSPNRQLGSPRSGRIDSSNGNKLIAIVLCIGIACFSALWYSPCNTDTSFFSSKSDNIHKPNEFARHWLEEQVNKLKGQRNLKQLYTPSSQNQNQDDENQHQNHNQNHNHHVGIEYGNLLINEPFSPSSGINVWDLYIPTISCPDLERLGKIGEGGKWMCGVNHLSSSTSSTSSYDSSESSNSMITSSSLTSTPPCIVYSFGISNDVSFEVDLLMRTKCIIHCFDPTIGELPFQYLPKNSKWFKIIQKQPLFKNRVYFHKLALGNITGNNEMHAISESLLDIMFKYNHTFINILKVDIEGGEWNVFNSLYKISNLQTLPIGQLLIELHYSNLYDISTFFEAMTSWNLYPFSREVKL